MQVKKDELQGKVAIVTGGGSGIGRGIVQRLSQGGASVVSADIDLAAAQQTVRLLNHEGGEAEACAVDVTDSLSVNDMVQFTVDRFGEPDILVNNAGIMFRRHIMDISLDEWQNTMNVNLTGPFICSQAVIPLMREKGYGRIINMSSSAGRSVSTLGGAHYTASKAGLLGLTRAIAKEIASFGITVNAICPGLIDTQMARDTTTPEELQNFIDSFPVQRLGLPEEIGDLVVFLGSERAAYITGISLDINGGDLMI
jgi:NAD(P)-dependent dehydrogenase (short-subunit alcohol dehydrogenase family)